MTTIIQGMSPEEFISTLNVNSLSADNITVDLLTSDLITAFHANYDHIKAIDSELLVKNTLIIGMSGASYIAYLNQNSQKISNISPYKIHNYIIPNQRGSEHGCLLDQFYDPSILKITDGSDLIGGISRGGAMSRENFSIIRDIIGNYSVPNLMGFDVNTTGTYDTHAKAAFIEKEGVIYVFFESLGGVSATNDERHNSPIIIKKSEDGGVTWMEVSRVNYLLCYPKVFIINGDFYLLAREVIGLSQKYIALFKSADDCVTWTKLTDPYISDDTWWSYHGIPNGEYDEINIVIFERNFQNGVSIWPIVGHIRSTDGIIYYNTDRSWSKNIVSDGSITRAEMITNCLISTYIDDAHNASYHGSFIKNDKLYSLISYGTGSLKQEADANTGLTVSVFTSAKIHEGKTELIDVSDLITDIEYYGYSPNQFMSLSQNGELFDVIHIDSGNGNDVKLFTYNLITKLSTKLLRIGTASAGGIQIGTSTFNVTQRADRIYVLGKLTGDELDLYNSYIDFVVLEPNSI